MREYVAKERPVIISGMLEDWAASKVWSPEYFKSLGPDLRVLIKEYADSKEIKTEHWTMAQYADFLIKEREVKRPAGDPTVLPYCHDIPLFSMLNSLAADCEPFPVDYLPKWYRQDWWHYPQFFIGPANSVTPLHFDTLLTHNLFFQLSGVKRFKVFMPGDAQFCSRRNWRWFSVDPEKPDLTKYPDYSKARPVEVLVKAGDILYLPPATPHHVRSLEPSISFNIDFHTKHSVVRGLLAIFQGMPAKNLYYNFLCLLGVVFNIPPRLIFRYYKSYLSYVS